MKNDRYGNIFWHQGEKVFDENEAERDSKVKKRIDQLENNITKCLLNLIEASEMDIKRNFISFLQKKIPGSIMPEPSELQFELQVQNKNKFRDYKNKYMVALISNALTPQELKEYEDAKESGKNQESIPDAAIFDHETVILIEAKTQSPLRDEQIKRHIANYFGEGACKSFKELYWEDIHDFLRGIETENNKDVFLISEYCEYLDLLGLSSNLIFSQEELKNLEYGSIQEDERCDTLRAMKIKVKRTCDLVRKNTFASIYKSHRLPTITRGMEVLWFGLYLTGENEKTSKRPNLNFTWFPDKLQIDLNAENKDSVEWLLSKIRSNPKKAQELFNEIPNRHIQIFSKLPLAAQSGNKYYWKKYDVRPDESILSLISSYKSMEDEFDDVKKQMIEDVKNHKNTDRFGPEKIKFATSLNLSVTGNSAIRIGTSLSSKEMIEMTKDKSKYTNYVISSAIKITDLLKLLTA